MMFRSGARRPLSRRVRHLAAALMLLAVVPGGAWFTATRVNLDRAHAVGDVVDSLDGVEVFHNGGTGHVLGRNLAPDGYNLGLKYQCVEFVKRYYYQRFDHRMPQDRGHARDFFQRGLADGTLNAERGLLQFVNGGASAPVAGDLVVFSPWVLNRYGHVAIVSAVGADFVEVIQQNPGPFGSSRERYALHRAGPGVRVDHSRLLGWLRMPTGAGSAAPAAD